MSDALMADTAFYPAEAAPPRDVHRAGAPAAPRREPGQLRVVEAAPNGTALTSLDREALSGANIIIYDRALAPIVAAHLPLGGYAEPAPAEPPAGDVISARSLHFALEGWNVVELVRARPSGAARAAWLKTAARQLLAEGGAAPGLQVLIIANSGSGAREPVATELAALAGGRLDALGLAGHLTIVFGAKGRPPAPHLSAVLTNGLAG